MKTSAITLLLASLVGSASAMGDTCSTNNAMDFFSCECFVCESKDAITGVLTVDIRSDPVDGKTCKPDISWACDSDNGKTNGFGTSSAHKLYISPVAPVTGRIAGIWAHDGQIDGFVNNYEANGCEGNANPTGCTNVCFLSYAELEATCPDTPPPPVTAGGDPHFKTWAQEWFDYHGECDMVFLSAPQFANGLGLDIHIRTKIQYEYSHIESAAIRIGQDTFELGGWGAYILNGIEGAQLPNTLSGYEVTTEKVSDNIRRFFIHISDTQAIEFKYFKNMVTVNMPAFPELEGSTGLLGDYPVGRTLARDGATVMTDMNAYGQEWQILPTEPKLFETTRLPQFPTQCRLPEPKKTSRRLGESVAEATARKACAGWGDAIEQCVYDVMATGDLELAAAGAF